MLNLTISPYLGKMVRQSILVRSEPIYRIDLPSSLSQKKNKASSADLTI